MTNDLSFKYHQHMKPSWQKSEVGSEKCHDIQIHYKIAKLKIVLHIHE